jgi:SAM-dependent methyltransferase
MNIISAWTRQVETGKEPSSSELRDHLTAVHNNNAGFTESFAWNCRDNNGKNSYELLADIINQKCHSSVLDLACGSGVLLDLCYQHFGQELILSGVDMSNAELQLARERLTHTNAKLYQSMAQDISFIADFSVDVILCHWALTLMDPVAPVFDTIKRVLKKGGVFAAIIDGDVETAPGYLGVHDIIYRYAQRKYPDYGVIELGDPRVRTAAGLKALAAETFVDHDIKITPVLLRLDEAPDKLASEAAGFFYASFVLSEDSYQQMLVDLESYFAVHQKNGVSSFSMPVNRLVIRQN